MTHRTTRLLALAAALAVGAGACDQNTTTNPEEPLTDGPTTLKLLLTDAAADYVDAAWVDIGKVQLLPEDGPAVTLTDDGTDGMINLLTLQDGATTELAEAIIDPGEYVQLRLFVDGASVELKDPYRFRDGSKTMDLKVPSGASSGIKLSLWPADGDGGGTGVMFVPGETVIVLDFDVDQSFRIQGNPETPAGIKSMHFQPHIRVTARDVAGSISGVVSGADDSINVDGLTVTAEPDGPATVPGYQTVTATSLTDEGAYTIYFLVPGDYDVSVAVPEGFFTDPLVAPVSVGEAEDVTGVDFLIDETGTISGTVSAVPGGFDVSGLTVMAEDGDGHTATGVTDGVGDYTIDPVIPGDWAVTVDVPEGYFTAPDTAMVTVGVGEDVTGVDFSIDETGSISGTIGPVPEGFDVSGLTVTAEADDGAPILTAETDGTGAYMIGDVWPGDYTVTVAVGEGFATNPASQPVTVGAAEAVPDIDFEVVEAGGG